MSSNLETVASKHSGRSRQVLLHKCSLTVKGARMIHCAQCGPNRQHYNIAVSVTKSQNTSATFVPLNSITCIDVSTHFKLLLVAIYLMSDSLIFSNINNS